MRRTRAIAVALTALALVAATAAISSAQMGCRGGMGRGMMAGPVFTDDQKEQIKKIEEKYEGDRTDLRNRMAALRLEMGDMFAADQPDFSKIESKIDEIAGVRVKLAKLRLKQHVEIRGILTDDQKKLFDRGFAAGRGHCGMGRMGGGGMSGCMPGCQMMGGVGGGMGGGQPGCRMMGGAGMGQGHPGCPMMGGQGGGAMQGMTKQRSERWRRWL